MFSEPKLYIPKTIKNEKKVPSLDGSWYVYFYFRDSNTGKMGRQPFKFYKNINRETTVAGRKRVGKEWIKVMRHLLENGFDPYDKEALELEGSKMVLPTIRKAFVTALANKKTGLKQGTYNSYRDYLNPFLKWCKQKGIGSLPVDKLTKEHLISYLNYLGREKPAGKGLQPTSVDNHKRNLSAIMGKMENDMVVLENFIKDIATKRNKPKKNAPFTVAEIEKIRKYALENDVLLYNFIRFIFYSFMRNVEIVRIQIKHINMVSRTIEISTKGEKLSHILMIGPMYRYLQEIEISKYPKEYFLFTPSGLPGEWNTTEKNKVNYFSRRFQSIRDHFEIDSHKTTYSFRHNAALDLYKSFSEEGLTENETINRLMKITRHKSEEALRNYLREIGGILPKDWGDSYTVSF